MIGGAFGDTLARAINALKNPAQADLSGMDMTGFGPFIENTMNRGLEEKASGLERASGESMMRAGNVGVPQRPNMSMDPKQLLLAGALTLGLNSMDRKGQAGARFSQSFGEARREAAEQKFQNDLLKAKQAREKEELQAHIEERQAQRLRGQQDDLRRQSQYGTTLAEGRLNREQEQRQFDATEANKLKVAGMRGDQSGVNKLIDLVKDENAPGAARATAALALRSMDGERYPFTEQDIEGLRAHTPRQAKDVAAVVQGERKLDQKDRELDQRMKRNASFFEVNKARIAQMGIRNGLDAARTAQIVQKTANYDAEFQLKAAGTLSLIAARAAKGSGKPVSAADLEKLRNLNGQQIKAWQEQAAGLLKRGDFASAAELNAKIIDLEKQNQAILDQARGTLQNKAKGGSATPSGTKYKVVG